MSNVAVWPPLNTSVTLEDGVTVIDEDGLLAVYTQEIRDLLRLGGLLTYDPRLGPTTSLDEAPSGHAAEHVLGGAQEIYADHLAIQYAAENYTPDTDDSTATDEDHLAAHLRGLDTLAGDAWALGTAGVATAATAQSVADNHDARHVRGGADEVDGDLLDVDYSPSNYTRAASTPVSSNAEHLAGHLSGIDTALSPYLVYVTEAGTSHSFSLSDAFKTIDCTSSSPVTCEIPLNVTIAFPVGTVIRFLRSGTGTVQITIAGGGTLNAPDGAFISAQNKFVFAERTATNTWLLSGSCST